MNKLQITNHKSQTNSNSKITIKPRSFVCDFGIWYCQLFVICGLLFGISGISCSKNTAQKINQVCFGDKCVQVEVVRKEEELHRGLQFRTSLAPDGGMLFVFQKSGPYAFWMKDTLIPLDMIWMDSERRIVRPTLRGGPLPTLPAFRSGPLCFGNQRRFCRETRLKGRRYDGV